MLPLWLNLSDVEVQLPALKAGDAVCATVDFISDGTPEERIKQGMCGVIRRISDDAGHAMIDFYNVSGGRWVAKHRFHLVGAQVTCQSR